MSLTVAPSSHSFQRCDITHFQRVGSGGSLVLLLLAIRRLTAVMTGCLATWIVASTLMGRIGYGRPFLFRLADALDRIKGNMDELDRRITVEFSVSSATCLLELEKAVISGFVLRQYGIELR